DSVGEALKIYALAELDLVQNNIQSAITRLQQIQSEFPSHTLKDDVYWLEANLEMKRGNFDQSISLLQKVLDEFGEDILADDAYFLQADIYHHQLKNKEKAQEMYREF